MARKRYENIIATDFMNGAVNVGKLHVEMHNVSELAILYMTSKVSRDGLKVYSWFRSELDVTQSDMFEAVIANHDGVAPSLGVTPEGHAITDIDGQQSAYKAIPVAITARTGADFSIFTHNFCKRWTWYQASVEQLDITLVDQGDGVTFKHTDHVNWIDLFQGEVTGERKLRASYPITVSDNGVEKTRHDPFEGTGGDYTLDPATGTVVFDSAPSGPVTATFHKATTPEFDIIPSSGEVWHIKRARANVSIDNWEMNTSLHYKIMVDIPGVGLVEIVESAYDTAQQMFDESESCSGDLVGPVGGATRGFTCTLRKMKLLYETTRDLVNSQGVRLRVTLGNGNAFGGTRFTLKLSGERESVT